MPKKIQAVDLFAGPGGLGEGFSSLEDTFEILVSAEMDESAHKTLLLRSFFRKLKYYYPEGLSDYYQFCNGEAELPWGERTQRYWQEAEQEALKLELGTPEDNAKLDSVLDKKLDKTKPWILIGGPPCQAYSLVGRARNKGISSYVAEEDPRHYLYKQYLRIIERYQPPIFIMENVKGILSSKINGHLVFHEILNDLTNPRAAIGKLGTGKKYRIYSLTTGSSFGVEDKPDSFDHRQFIIKSENYGIPQARHRVILVGIREDYLKGKGLGTLRPQKEATVGQCIGSLPRLRSKLSKQKDSYYDWQSIIKCHAQELINELEFLPNKKPLTESLYKVTKTNSLPASYGSNRFSRNELGSTGNNELDIWYQDFKLKKWLNHESRGHMNSDLRRYLFASVYAKVNQRSPKGHTDFFLESLYPSHKNWVTGKFSDRFRVQLDNNVSTTITSHISKDGHYYIHPDPFQCRSLTVREAARLQTFPDNYFFQGNRTQQFHQVGNAVPPLLSRKIAQIIKLFFNENI